jgi:hypothetical protein
MIENCERDFPQTGKEELTLPKLPSLLQEYIDVLTAILTEMKSLQ